MTLPWSIPDGAAGLTVHAQAAAFDPTQPQGLAFTNGLLLSIGN